MLKVSLREFLLLVAFAAFACAALTYSNNAWLAAVASVAMVLFFRALIVAAVERGPSQAFAIGMTLVMAGYGLVLVCSRIVHNGDTLNMELSNLGHLPTTQLLGCLDRGISDYRWIDGYTGREDPLFQPPLSVNQIDLSPDWLRELLRAGRHLPGVSFHGKHVVKVPNDGEFYRTGHSAWAVVLGFLGGAFARSLYQRRVSRPVTSG
jgi:hypothetical protein